jgi:hypothetical protein
VDENVWEKVLSSLSPSGIRSFGSKKTTPSVNNQRCYLRNCDIEDNLTILFTNGPGGKNICNEMVRIRKSTIILVEGETSGGIQSITFCLPGR